MSRRGKGRVQLSIIGKGGKVRQVLLPAIVSRSLLSLRGELRPLRNPSQPDEVP
jgi:hypothetical protein